MIDPRREAVLIRPSDGIGGYVDRTSEIRGYTEDHRSVHVTFVGNPKAYPYSRQRVAIGRRLTRYQLAPGERFEVRARVWDGSPEVYHFEAGGHGWWRFFWNSSGQQKYATYPDSDVRLVRDASRRPEAARILAYWKDLTSHLSDDRGGLGREYEKLDFVHPESALARYLEAAPITGRNWDEPIIFPFSCNLSQRIAVDNALRYPVSVIDGPPGTGKTQTILNLIANLVDADTTVGIVSFNNAAVDNVGEKLTRAGFGYVIARLGNEQLVTEFFDMNRQASRNAEIDGLLSGRPPSGPDAQRIRELDGRLRRLQETERDAAELRRQIDAYRLQLRHFLRYIDRGELPDLDHLPLLRRPADRIIDYLVDNEVDRIDRNSARKLLRRIRRYFAYGSTRRIDPDDTAVILRLQQAYYERTLAELERKLDRCDSELARGGFARLAEEHRQLSTQALSRGLWQRYHDLGRARFAKHDYRQRFHDFVKHFPVLLSTCHSIGRNVDGQLLDYLIIDEASQADLLTAGLAMASARNVVVVGDLRQIEHIADQAACDRGGPAPYPAYDYGRHNILSSLAEVFNGQLPRTMLREHYRCDPAIIEFCNKKFYGGDLIPYKATDPTQRPLAVHRTTEGNHMRRHRDGARTNQRELDVISEELIDTLVAKGIERTDIGVTTPYRRQADKAVDVLDTDIQADTVHKFQGREKDVVIMTTVLDETRHGRTGLRFADDPHLVNVAVSRAVRQFFLVTNHDLLPRSRNLRDLIGYIRYQDPDQGLVDSEVVSVFDLLYQKYSARLEPIARRIEGKMAYKSEEIASVVLRDILDEQRYQGLQVVSQVLLRNLIPDPQRLTAEQARYVRHPRTSIDFLIYNGVTMEPILAIEVDGFAFHENNPDQLARDALKDAICQAHDLPLLRLPTTGSQEQETIRRTLDRLLDQPASASPPETRGRGAEGHDR